MMPWAVFGLSLLLSVILIPLVRKWSIHLGKVAKPRDDRWHTRPTATLGGIGIYLAFLLSLVGIIAATGNWGNVRWGALAGSTLMFLLGLIDDFKRISPQAKLIGQIIIAALVISLGYTTNFFTPRFPDSIFAQIPNILLTFLWLVGITNAINLLDNMDGLAGGIALITAGILSFFFWSSGDTSLLVLSLALAGSVLGFLIYNFPPASIFMGDSGSLFLGFSLALLAIARQPQASNVIAVMAVPTLLFLLPILDTTLVTITRIMRGQSPAQGGRDHTSHRLIAFGLTEKQAVLTLYAVAIVSGIMAAALESIEYWYSLVLVPILLITLALLTAYLGGLKVGASTTTNSGRTLTRIMLDLTFKRRLFEVTLDFFLIGLTYYLAILTWYSFQIEVAGLQNLLISFPVVLGCVYFFFFVFGVYKRLWRYLGAADLLVYLQATVCGVFSAALILSVISQENTFPPGIFLLFGIYLFLGLAASRGSFKILDVFSSRQVTQSEERVLICGAGDAGEMALRWIIMNPQLNYLPVGIIDQDPYLLGKQIHGVMVLGDIAQLPHLLEQKKIAGVIVTDNILKDETLGQKVLSSCSQNGCWVRNLRLGFELVE